MECHLLGCSVVFSLLYLSPFSCCFSYCVPFSDMFHVLFFAHAVSIIFNFFSHFLSLSLTMPLIILLVFLLSPIFYPPYLSISLISFCIFLSLSRSLSLFLRTVLVSTQCIRNLDWESEYHQCLHLNSTTFLLIHCHHSNGHRFNNSQDKTVI